MTIRSRLMAIVLVAVACVAVTSRGAVAQPVETHSAPADHRAADHEVAGAGHAEEEPKLLLDINQGLVTAITTLVIFVALVAVLGKFAWAPIANGLQAREDKIRKDIADAEAARQRAEATLGEYNQKLAAAQEQIRQMIGQAQKDAEGVAAGMKVKAQQEVEEIKERALKDIDSGKNAAMAEIHSHAANLATSVAEKILRRNINDDDHRALVQSSLEELGSMARN